MVAHMGDSPTVAHPAKGTRGTYCVFQPEVDPSDLEEALRMANRWMAARATGLGKLVASGVTVEYFITLQTDRLFGFELDPALLGACAQLGVSLGVQVIPMLRSPDLPD